jgi:hypothetical protein
MISCLDGTLELLVLSHLAQMLFEFPNILVLEIETSGASSG